jgi:hypothetical protein
MLVIILLITISSKQTNWRKELLQHKRSDNLIFHKNHTRIVNKEKTGTGTCPPTVTTEVEATCELKYDAVGTAAASATWANGAGVIAAVGDFFTACPLTSCREDCKNFATNKEVGEYIATFSAEFASKCEPQRRSGKSACSPRGSNGATCGAKITAVSNAAKATAWVGATIRDAVDAFIDDCKSTSCDASCINLVSEIDFQPKNIEFEAEFVKNCLLAKISVPATCSTDKTDDEKCKTIYDSIVAGSTSTAWGDGSKLVVAVNDFISKCKKSLCNEGCDTTVNEKDFASVLAGFEENFKNKCKPAEPESNNNNNGLRKSAMSYVLVAMSIAVASIHLILLN